VEKQNLLFNFYGPGRPQAQPAPASQLGKPFPLFQFIFLVVMMIGWIISFFLLFFFFFFFFSSFSSFFLFYWFILFVDSIKLDQVAKQQQQMLVLFQNLAVASQSTAVVKVLAYTSFYNTVKPSSTWEPKVTARRTTNADEWAREAALLQTSKQKPAHDSFLPHKALPPLASTSATLWTVEFYCLFGDEIKADEYLLNRSRNGLHVLCTVELKKVAKTLGDDSKGQALMQAQKLLEIQPNHIFAYSVRTQPEGNYLLQGGGNRDRRHRRSQSLCLLWISPPEV
jgi:hypothetical protein